MNWLTVKNFNAEEILHLDNHQKKKSGTCTSLLTIQASCGKDKMDIPSFKKKF